MAYDKNPENYTAPLQYLPVYQPLSCALVRVSSPVVTDRSGERARRPSGEEGGGAKAHKKKGKKGKHRSGSASHRSHRSHGTGSGSGRTFVASGLLAIALLSLTPQGCLVSGRLLFVLSLVGARARVCGRQVLGSHQRSHKWSVHQSAVEVWADGAEGQGCRADPGVCTLHAVARCHTHSQAWHN